MNSCRCYCCCCWWRHHNHFSTLSIQFQIGGFNCFTSHIFYDFLWDLCLPFGHYLQRCIRNVALLCGMMVHIKSFLPKSWPPDWPSTIRCWIAQQQPQIVSKLLFDLDNAMMDMLDMLDEVIQGITKGVYLFDGCLLPFAPSLLALVDESSLCTWITYFSIKLNLKRNCNTFLPLSVWILFSFNTLLIVVAAVIVVKEQT